MARVQVTMGGGEVKYILEQNEYEEMRLLIEAESRTRKQYKTERDEARRLADEWRGYCLAECPKCRYVNFTLHKYVLPWEVEK